jgi:hypothetical protein
MQLATCHLLLAMHSLLSAFGELVLLVHWLLAIRLWLLAVHPLRTDFGSLVNWCIGALVHRTPARCPLNPEHGTWNGRDEV